MVPACASSLALEQIAGSWVEFVGQVVREGVMLRGTVRGAEPTEMIDNPDAPITARLQKTIEELQQAVSARDAFLATAAHELRNPMTPIVGQVQRLRRFLQSDRYNVTDMERGLARLESLIGQYVKRATTLLDVSRITSGKLNLETVAFDLSALVVQVVAAHEPAAQFAQTPLNAVIPENVVIVSDRLAVEQILDNLLLNAIKYGAGKPVDIILQADSQQCLLVVRDQGIGISDEAKARIFEPFERAVASSSKAGFGVGLWVVRQLVDALGGQIVVDSVLNHGSSFSLTLPCRCESKA